MCYVKRRCNACVTTTPVGRTVSSAARTSRPAAGDQGPICRCLWGRPTSVRSQSHTCTHTHPHGAHMVCDRKQLSLHCLNVENIFISTQVKHHKRQPVSRADPPACLSAHASVQLSTCVPIVVVMWSMLHHDIHLWLSHICLIVG